MSTSKEKKGPVVSDEVAVELPRLSIIELMVLTAAMAITFAFQENLQIMNAAGSQNAVWFDSILRVYYALVYGLPIAAVYRFVIQKRVTGKFLLYPGHWVLFGILISAVGYMLPTAVNKALGFSDAIGGFLGNWQLLPYVIFSFVSAAVLFRGAMFYRRAWKVMLMLMGVSMLASGIQTIAIAIVAGSGPWNGGLLWVLPVVIWGDFATKILLLIALVPVLWTEFKSAKRRDIWHWAGILLIFLVSEVGLVLLFIFMRFLAP